MSTYTYKAEISLTVTPSTDMETGEPVRPDEIFESIRTWLERTPNFSRHQGDPGTLIPRLGSGERVPAAHATDDTALTVHTAALQDDDTNTVLAFEGVTVEMALDVLARHFQR